MIGFDIREERHFCQDTSSAAMIAVISLPQQRKQKRKKRQKLTKLDAIQPN